MNILHLLILIIVMITVIMLIVKISDMDDVIDEVTEHTDEMNDMLLQSLRRTEQLQADYDRLLAKLEPYQTKEWQNPNPWKDGAE